MGLYTNKDALWVNDKNTLDKLLTSLSCLTETVDIINSSLHNGLFRCQQTHSYCSEFPEYLKAVTDLPSEMLLKHTVCTLKLHWFSWEMSKRQTCMIWTALLAKKTYQIMLTQLNWVLLAFVDGRETTEHYVKKKSLHPCSSMAQCVRVRLQVWFNTSKPWHISISPHKHHGTGLWCSSTSSGSARSTPWWAAPSDALCLQTAWSSPRSHPCFYFPRSSRWSLPDGRLAPVPESGPYSQHQARQSGPPFGRATHRAAGPPWWYDEGKSQNRPYCAAEFPSLLVQEFAEVPQQASASLLGTFGPLSLGPGCSLQGWWDGEVYIEAGDWTPWPLPEVREWRSSSLMVQLTLKGFRLCSSVRKKTASRFVRLGNSASSWSHTSLPVLWWMFGGRLGPA